MMVIITYIIHHLDVKKAPEFTRTNDFELQIAHVLKRRVYGVDQDHLKVQI